MTRADAITAITVTSRRSSYDGRTTWYVVLTYLGGPQGGWANEAGGTLSPLQADLTASSDSQELEDLPEELARALVRHHCDAGALAVNHREVGNGLRVEGVIFLDWSKTDEAPHAPSAT